MFLLLVGDLDKPEEGRKMGWKQTLEPQQVYTKHCKWIFKNKIE